MPKAWQLARVPIWAQTNRHCVPTLRKLRYWLTGITALALLGSAGFAISRGGWRQPSRAWQQVIGQSDSNGVDQHVDELTRSRIEAFCGDCHRVPLVESFPSDAWHDMVWRGYEFYARSGRTDLDPPPAAATAAYYRARAPAQFSFPELADAAHPLGTAFVKRRLPGSSIAPAIAYLRWLPLQQQAPARLLACDMRDGRVMAVDLQQPEVPRQVLARLNHPCHAETCDLDGDGILDLVVADLGSFTPDDHDLGRVVWLRGRGQSADYEEVVLANGLGRVADVRPADVDLDGDLDLIVAEFGLHATGSILLLQNTGGRDGLPKFKPRPIDPRPGTIHVPVCDLNGDAYPDFLALISQEYESVEAFVNQGNGEFRAYPLWSAPDLTFGSSGIEPVDMDQDGDLDVLYTNGDSFDNSFANPTHGVQWLENIGNLTFEYHRLTDLVGAFRALPADVDLDGDLDIVAVAWLPEEVKPARLATMSLPALLCLEQTSPGVFVRHTLEAGLPRNAALEIADLDNDGDPDLVVGAVGAHWITVWTNEARRTGGDNRDGGRAQHVR